MTHVTCTRCRFVSRVGARFCGRCGLNLESADGSAPRPGTARHPRPVDVPPGCNPVERAAGLYFRSESSLGGAALISTEGLNVTIANVGYNLIDVVLRVIGERDGDKPIFAIERTIADLPRGGEAVFEIPSYEIPAPIARLRIELVSAAFGAWEAE